MVRSSCERQNESGQTPALCFGEGVGEGPGVGAGLGDG